MNIMAKVDNLNYASDGTPLLGISDALAAFCFANSNLEIVFNYLRVNPPPVQR